MYFNGMVPLPLPLDARCVYTFIITGSLDHLQGRSQKEKGQMSELKVHLTRLNQFYPDEQILAL